MRAKLSIDHRPLSVALPSGRHPNAAVLVVLDFGYKFTQLFSILQILPPVACENLLIYKRLSLTVSFVVFDSLIA
jgi:hypothetical protein